MKVYIVFRLKHNKNNLTKGKKEFIVDSVYLNKSDTMIRQSRIHNMCIAALITANTIRAYKNKRRAKAVLVSDLQETYVINKTLKGFIC